MPPQKRSAELDFTLPEQPANLSHLDEIEWQRCAVVLRQMALTGLAMRCELSNEIAHLLACRPYSSMIKRTFYTLTDAQLITSELVPLIGASRVTLVCLTYDGIDYCNSVDWPPLENEWKALIARRNADAYPQYAAWVLQFAYHARMRHWNVEVAPEENGKIHQADLVVRRDGITPVHVIGATRLPLTTLQEIAKDYPQLNLVASRPQHLNHLRSMFKLGDISGKLTDLESLINQARQGELGDLWMETI
jgi:hypothetical protein